MVPGVTVGFSAPPRGVEIAWELTEVAGASGTEPLFKFAAELPRDGDKGLTASCCCPTGSRSGTIAGAMFGIATAAGALGVFCPVIVSSELERSLLGVLSPTLVRSGPVLWRIPMLSACNTFDGTAGAPANNRDSACTKPGGAVSTFQHPDE
jgi:hypothetical protein